MIRLILGLGNPGAEYENTRHNAGKMAALRFAGKNDYPEFKYDKKSSSLVSKSGQTAIALPETFMNKSGSAAAKLIRPKREMRELIVIHDDLDLPLGRFKIGIGFFGSYFLKKRYCFSRITCVHVRYAAVIEGGDIIRLLL